jgi:hypothetical protein
VHDRQATGDDRPFVMAESESFLASLANWGTAGSSVLEETSSCSYSGGGGGGGGGGGVGRRRT